jgi:hypothetical protein
MGRNKSVICKRCYRVMRSDHLKNHTKLHDKYVEVEPLPNITSSYVPLESVSSGPFYKPTSMDEEELLKKMLKGDREYKEKMEMGKKMYQFVKEYDIDEKSISKEMREPLEIYKEQKQTVDVENVILKSWQESLLNYMKPSDREIIWVQGRYCGEGKTWFQDYVESKYGYKRVVAGMDIKLKKSSICHVLRKRRLATTDIFLFDVGKAKTFDTINYEVLEKLKNGRILASKFDSVELKLRTPNIVVVFSNDRPEVNQLARDRWKIFSIENDDLVEKPLSQSKPKPSTPIIKKNKYSSNFLGVKKKRPTYLYNDEEKIYTLLSSNDNVIKENSVEKKKECNYDEGEKADDNKRATEDIVEYPILKNKDIETNNTLVQRKRFKITDH